VAGIGQLGHIGKGDREGGDHAKAVEKEVDSESCLVQRHCNQEKSH